MTNKLVTEYNKIKGGTFPESKAKTTYCLSEDSVVFKGLMYMSTHMNYVILDGDNEFTEWENSEVFDTKYDALRFCITNQGQVNIMMNNTKLIEQIYKELE